MALRRLVEGLKSPWSLAFSGFGVAYGAYYIIDTTQAGEKYDPAFDLSGKTYIVTGATSGIGEVTASELAKRNARVIMACRNRERCVQVRRDIVLQTRNKQVYCRQCDLSDLDSIKTFVSRLSAGKFELDRIDGVIHNAAVMDGKRHVTASGIEETLATNHMGVFLMTGLLLDKLFAQDHPVRLVFLNTNVIARKCALDLSNLNSEVGEKGKFDGYEVYKKSKLAQALFARELADRVKGTNIHVLIADPGRTKTALDEKLNYQSFFLSRWLLAPISFFMGRRKPDKAVKPVLYAVADPDAAELNGAFIGRDRTLVDIGDILEDAELRKKLWAVSLSWTKFDDAVAAVKAEVNATTGATLKDKANFADASGGQQTSEETQPGASTGKWYYLWLR